MAICIAIAWPVGAWATPVGQPNFEVLADRCAPNVPSTTLAAVARTESGLDPWALHDNTTGISEKPTSRNQALADAEAWIARGDSVDVGLMQVNTANFNALGLTVLAALDPCASLAGGAAVLQAAYGGGKTTAEQQVALLIALSRYNTGTPLKGIMNGYARAVVANANAVQLPVPARQSVPATSAVLADPNAPPSWDISATGAYAEAHGASWIVPFPSLTQGVTQPRGQPADTAAKVSVVADTVATSLTPSTRRSQ